jgi:hypothetical protein
MSNATVLQTALIRSRSLRHNHHVRRIYSALEATGEGSWDLVTVVETDLMLDATQSDYRQADVEDLIQDGEADLRNGIFVGCLTFRSV